MLDAQPGAVVADGGAAVRFLESAAGVGVQPLPVAAAEQARFRVDDVFPTHAEAAQADIVGAVAVSEPSVALERSGVRMKRARSMLSRLSGR
ncbi:MAG: hypothetical protein ACYCZS_09745 [Thiobacillus sp.]